MKANNFDKFIKLMQMTQSDQDGEVLTAIRMANTMLAENNANWEELLRSKVKVSAKPEPAFAGKRYTNSEEIEEMLREILGSIKTGSSFFAFIESLKEWWEDKGFLTEKQYNSLRKSYARLK